MNLSLEWRKAVGSATASSRTDKGAKRWQVARLLRTKAHILRDIEEGLSTPSDHDVDRYFAYSLFLRQAPSLEKALSLPFCRRCRIRVVIEANRS